VFDAWGGSPGGIAIGLLKRRMKTCLQQKKEKRKKKKEKEPSEVEKGEKA